MASWRSDVCPEEEGLARFHRVGRLWLECTDCRCSRHARNHYFLQVSLFSIQAVSLLRTRPVSPTFVYPQVPSTMPSTCQVLH